MFLGTNKIVFFLRWVATDRTLRTDRGIFGYKFGDDSGLNSFMCSFRLKGGEKWRGGQSELKIPYVGS